MTLGQSRREWKASPGGDRYRRGLYTFFWRATPHPALMVFDGPDAFSTCTRRPRSNTPLQALTLLNDEAFFDFAQALARRVLRESSTADTRLDLAFRRFLAGQPGESDECYLPDAVAGMIDSGQARVRVIPTASRWCGITYAEDRPRVEAELAELVRRGEYPARLWA